MEYKLEFRNKKSTFFKKVFQVGIFFSTFLIFGQNSQPHTSINNLKTFLQVAELSALELTENLQYEWEILRPTEIIDGDIITGRYTYKIEFEDKYQILQRVIKINHKQGIKMESSNLIFNDEELLERFKTNLAHEGFKLHKKEGNESLYKDGYKTILLQEVTITRGQFRMEIFPW